MDHHQEEEIIAGLPDDLGRECLCRIPYEYFPTIASVHKRWKAEIESRDFLFHRKSTGSSQVLVVLAQETHPGAPQGPTLGGLHSCIRRPPPHHLVVYEPISGRWADLPPPPTSLPAKPQLAAVGPYLVVMGGFDRSVSKFLNSVYIYSFKRGSWRRGADMPGPGLRESFCCASDARTVFVAGGYDIRNYRTLSSAAAYDVERDRWMPMPDMAVDRYHCRAFFRDGKFHVFGGISTNRPGEFSRSIEAFNPATWQWNHPPPPLDNVLLEADMYPAIAEDCIYMLRKQNCDIVTLLTSTRKWHTVAKLPPDLASPLHSNLLIMMSWHGKLMVFETTNFYSGKRRHVAYTFDLQTSEWTEVEEASNHVVAQGCCLEI